MLQQIFLILIIAAGFFIGYILPRFTQEEMLPGKKYFKALEIILFIGILVTTLVLSHSTSAILTIAVVCGLSFSIGFPRRLIVIYLFLALLMIIQPHNTLASLGFIYGLPAGTLYKLHTIQVIPKLH